MLNILILSFENRRNLEIEKSTYRRKSRQKYDPKTTPQLIPIESSLTYTRRNGVQVYLQQSMVNGRELRAPPPLNEQKEGQCMKFIMDVGPSQRLSRPSVILPSPFFSSPFVVGVRTSNDYITRK